MSHKSKNELLYAKKDFNDMHLSEVTEFDTQYGKAKRGTTDSGETIILRPGSSDGAPTIEHQRNGQKKVEIRYDN